MFQNQTSSSSGADQSKVLVPPIAVAELYLAIGLEKKNYKKRRKWCDKIEGKNSEIKAAKVTVS